MRQFINIFFKICKTIAVFICLVFLAISAFLIWVGAALSTPFFRLLNYLDPDFILENDKCDSDFI